MNYNSTVQKKNARNSPPVPPRKLVMLVAAALAGGPVYAAMEPVRGAPIAFERNIGQFAPEVLFVTRGTREVIALRSGGVYLAPTGQPDLRLRLSGANLAPEVEEREPLAARTESRPHFGRLMMKDVYPSIDLALHGAGGELEYDFVVAPGADPAGIRLDLSRADEAWVDANGDLHMRMAGGELLQRAPVAWQKDGDQRNDIPARFEVRHTDAGLEAHFVTAAYDSSRELVIDPILSFSSYLGSSGGDFGGFMKIDSATFMHSAKINASSNANQIVLAKQDPITAGLAWAVRVDGNYGTRLTGHALGPTGTPYVVGSTPLAGPLFDWCDQFLNCHPLNAGAVGGSGDAFVLSFNGGTGAFASGRYIGGSGMDEATGIAVDGSGNVYVTGNTRSPNFPATVGTYHTGSDVFVARFSPDLSTMDMAVLLGSSGDETSAGIAVDPSGNIYVAMQSSSTDYPPDHPDTGGNYLVKLGPDGSFLHSTSLGASGNVLAAVSIDGAGQPVVAGNKYDSGFTNPDIFYARISDTGSLLELHSAGGASSETVRGLTVAGDSVYVVGETFSSDFPTVGTPTVGASGGSEAFVTRFGPEGLEYAARFGGSADEFTNALAVAPSGDVYLMGTTTSPDFPLASPWRSDLNGGSDLFIARVSNQFDLAAPAIPIAADTIDQKILITRTGSLAGSASVKWATVNGTAAAGTHYGTPGSLVRPNGTVTFPPGVGAMALHVGVGVSGPNTIPIIGSASFASTKAFSISLSAPTGGPAIGDVATGTVSISAGSTSLMIDGTAVNVLENAGTASVRVVRNGNTDLPATVKYTTVNGTALAGSHYTMTSGTLTFGAGVIEQFVTVPIINNAVANPSRTFQVVLSAPTGLPISGPTSATVTILDEDNTIALGAATAVATEGNASVTLQVRRTGSPTLAASVQWSTQDVSAFAGTDFGTTGITDPVAGTFTWAAGDATVRNIVIPILDDGTPEATKTFKVNLSGVVNATLGTATTTVTLNDNERGFAFLLPEYSVIENQPSVTLTVRRLGSASVAASVTWTTADGTATVGQDYGLKGSAMPRTGTLTWTAGDTANKTIVIPIINDTVANEPDETFTVSLATATPGHIITSPGIATVTILDDDIPPQSAVQFSQPKYLTTEDAGTVTLEVQRVDVGGGFGRESRVNYATQPGTALATSDYMTKTGTLVWPAGDSSPKQIAVTLVNNTIAEPTETFTVTLSSPIAGTALGSNKVASVVIFDDDEKFPPHGVIPDGFTTPVDATKGWHVAGDAGAYEGFLSLKSDEIDDGETAAIQMEGTFAAGNVSFRVRVSSEAGFDKLNFYVDGVPQTSWSGTTITGWQMSPSYLLTAGHHLLRWEYAKDGSISLGQDAAFIDGLVTPAFTP